MKKRREKREGERGETVEGTDRASAECAAAARVMSCGQQAAAAAATTVRPIGPPLRRGRRQCGDWGHCN